MNEVKHTQGPWRLEQDTTLVWGACNPDDTSDRGMGYPIAECRITPVSYFWAKGPSIDEGEANARLIATAPELLEALYEAEEYFDNRADADHDETGFVPNKEMTLLVSIRAAIAKATGSAK